MPLAEAFVRSGKVRDLYRLDDERLLLVASDRLSAFDVVLPTPIPDKGRVLTGLSRFWFHETAPPRPEPPAVGRPGRRAGRASPGGNPAAMDELRGRLMIGRHGRGAPDRVRRPRLPVRLAAGRSTGRAAPCAASRCRTACASRTASRRRSSRPAWKAPQGQHDENITVRAGRRARRRAARGGAAAAVDPAVRAGGRGVREGGDHPRRHEVRVRRAARRRAHPHRRGHDARQLAVLGRRRRTSRAGRRRATTSSSSATGSRPSRGPRPSPGRRCPPTSSHGTRQRYVEAYERITGASFARYLEEDVIAR